MKRIIALSACLSVILFTIAQAEDQPQWGQGFSRNMASAEENLPESFAALILQYNCLFNFLLRQQYLAN